MEKRKNRRGGAGRDSLVPGQKAKGRRRQVLGPSKRGRGKGDEHGEPSASSEDPACRCHPERDSSSVPPCAGCSRKERVAKRKPPRVPPPESEVWPEQYRGENWKPAYAFIFEGKCQLCAHSCPLPKSRQLMDKFQGNTRLLHCTNHPGYPGEIVEVLPTDTCRNFKPKCWKLPVDKAKESPRCPTPGKRGQKVERIPLGDNLFALVDAADFKGEIGKHRWYVTYRGSNVYSMCFVNRKPVYMHRMIARPRRGYIVDHKDGNGLNNCRDNLRACTRRQNQANRRSRRGASRFVGVYPHKDKWVAEIRSHGRYFYLGLFDDEVQAAKARDRKAWELHGEFAYLNFPEDFAKKRRRRSVRA